MAGAVGSVAGIVKSASRSEKSGDGLTGEQRQELQTQGITDAALDEVLKAADRNSRKAKPTDKSPAVGRGFFYVRE